MFKGKALRSTKEGHTCCNSHKPEGLCRTSASCLCMRHTCGLLSHRRGSWRRMNPASLPVTGYKALVGILKRYVQFEGREGGGRWFRTAGEKEALTSWGLQTQKRLKLPSIKRSRPYLRRAKIAITDILYGGTRSQCSVDLSNTLEFNLKICKGL